MNKIEQLSANENHDWQTLETYAEEHPFVPPTEKSVAHEVSNQTLEESVFVNTGEPIPELSESAENILVEHPEVFNPTDESVMETAKPFLELIRQDAARLTEIAQEIKNGEQLQKSLETAVAYFCEKFSVKNIPSVEIRNDSDSSADGSYIPSETGGRIKVRPPRVQTFDNLARALNVVAHEVWHAHQDQYATEHIDDHNETAEKYRLNFMYLQKGSIDYDAYRSQITEKEAFCIGDGVEDIYLDAYLSANPKEVESLHKRYTAWIRDKYDPGQDGLSYKTLIVAHDNFRRNGKRRGRIFTKINNKLSGK